MSVQTFLDGKVTLHAGDCRDVIATLPDASIDSIVTDPPYALVSIVKRFGKEGAAPPKDYGSGNGLAAYARAARGFMGKQWDTGEAAFAAEFWAECLRVLKPGGHVAAFSGTRTYHRLAIAIEDAGFEIRDQLAWAYGSGFPKSLDVSKAMDKAAGAAREKIRIRARPETSGTMAGASDTRPWIEKSRELGYHEVAGNVPATHAAREWQGWGTALKPAWEPICLARKPLIGTVAANVLAHGTGAINVDGCRVGAETLTYAPKGTSTSAAMIRVPAARMGKAGEETTVQGRHPANILHDGSPEVLACFPETESGKPGIMRAAVNNGAAYGAESRPAGTQMTGFGDSGSAARFFYSAKADASDRIGSKHPTVKPVDLMQWLCRLITPPGGVVLDPFAGTGTTGEAAFREGFSAILIEREEEYRADIAKRMGFAVSSHAARKRAHVAARAPSDDHGPLFGTPDPERGGADRFTGTLPTNTNDWPDRPQKMSGDAA